MPVAFRDVQYGTRAVGHRRQRLAKRPVNGCGSRPDVGLRTNDAGNLRTGVPCSGSAAVRSRVTAADSLGGPIWTGHSRSPPPLLRRRPPGWLGAPYGARASLPFGATLRGSPAGAGKGLRPFNPPGRPALRYGFAAVSRGCGCFSSLPCPRAAGFSPWTFRRVESPTVSSTSDARDDSPENPLSPFPSLTESSSTRLDVASSPYPANHLTGDSRSSTRRASLPPGCGRCPFPDTAIPP